MLAARINAADQAAKGSPSPAAAASSLTAAQKAQVEVLRKEGRKYYDAKQYAKARASYEKLLRTSPNDGWALYELGNSIIMIEGGPDTDIDSMQSVWKRAVALQPTDTKLLLELGDVLYTWDPAVADAAYRRVLALSPDPVIQAQAHAGMGWAHYFYLNSRAAEAEFKEAMRLDPANDNYLYALGVTYAKAGQRDAAMGVFRQLTTRNQKMAQELLATINKK
jgi:tetratricopeptide (TPR) repeat protein